MTLGDVTDDSDGHHQPPGKESLPGEISRIDQPNPGDEDEVADLNQRQRTSPTTKSCSLPKQTPRRSP